MSVIKSVFKRWNGSTWETYYFDTSADLVAETTNLKIMTAAERTAIANNLDAFNAANKLLKLDGDGLIPTNLIPGGLDYLPVNNPAWTGTLSGLVMDLADGGSIALNRATAANQVRIDFSHSGNHRLEVQVGSTSSYKFNPTTFDLGTGRRILNVANPDGNNDAANKQYVDNLVGEGVRPVDSVKAASTGNVTLSGTQSIDSVSLGVGDRVLVKNQTTTAQNGIYTVASGAWTKVGADSSKGALVFIENGAQNNDSKWYAETDTSWIKFSQVDSYNVIQNGGLQRVANNFGIASGGVTNAMLGGNIEISKLQTFTVNDSVASGSWQTPSVATSLQNRLDHITSVIKAIRGGVANFSTSVPTGETIFDTRALALAKNRTYTSEPASADRVVGDLWFDAYT